MSRVLITGAAGFLGRHFVQHHIDAGDDVTGVDDMSNPFSYWPLTEPGTPSLKHGLIQDAADFLAGAGEYDLAYHFAGSVVGRAQIEHDPLFNADSFRLDAAFFRWAVGHTKVAVYPSSSAVYGIHYQTSYDLIRLREAFLDLAHVSSIPAPDELYGYTKLIGEVLASKAELYGLNTLCIRPFSGYGEDQPTTYPMRAIAQRVVRREDPLTIWGSGNQKRDFIHVDDVVGATVARLEAGVKGYETMNIGSGTGTSFFDLAGMMALIDDYNPTVVADPAKPEGVFTRIADPERMLRYYRPKVSLTEGLARVLSAARAAEDVVDEGVFQ